MEETYKLACANILGGQRCLASIYSGLEAFIRHPTVVDSLDWSAVIAITKNDTYIDINKRNILEIYMYVLSIYRYTYACYWVDLMCCSISVNIYTYTHIYICLYSYVHIYPSIYLYISL